ncbi:MAG TPA: LON peptidase substrate-binding domain-containing protein, partial [Candidatus Acidoferrum sp.]|nr:LON peptidase substrate-binding domain-containing protein [Candidatus Acidoferrum sp.]
MAVPTGAGDVTIPDALPILPLRDGVVFPQTAMPLAVGQARSVRLIDDVMRGNRLLALVAQRDPQTEPATLDDLHRVGTAGMIHQLARGADGSVRLMVQGLERVRVLDLIATEPYLVGRVERAAEPVAAAPETDALRRAVVEIFGRLVAVSPELPDELAASAQGVGDPRQLVYFVASVVPLAVAARQELLELDPITAKLRRLVDLLQRELAVRELGRKITSETEERLTKAQREHYLREQVRSIQRELGDEEAGAGEIAELRRKLEEAGLPEDARREADRELGRLANLSPASPEYGMIRTYLEWMTSLPWSRLDGGTIDIHKARGILDEDHYDLDKVKDRILEYLAVKKLRQERAGRTAEAPPVAGDTPAREPILCFVGPPGVGKTSLGQSVARALGRKFVRMSLGGVRDEAEIRGHRRTYIGAMPGRIVQGLRRAERRDPVFMLDEIDKIGADWRGDPAAALLEVLDPAQNHTFVDNYLGVPFDLSQVLFIATANTLETIPDALRDRLEILQLSGYTDHEKIEIARRYL